MTGENTISFRSLGFLVVTDCEFTRDLIHFALEAFQAEDIQDAVSMPEVLQTLRVFVPDVVLTEMSLHTDGGTGVIHHLQAITRHLKATTAVVVFTNRPIEIDIFRAIRAGADDILRWPFSAHFLSQRIARALIRRNAGLRAPNLATRRTPLKPKYRSPEWPSVAESAVRAYRQVTLTAEEIQALTVSA